MKKIYLIATAIIVSTCVTYGAATSHLHPLVVIILLCMLMIMASLMTVPLIQDYHKSKDLKDKDIYGLAFGGIFFSLFTVLGIYDPDSQLWTTIATVVILLIFTPHLMTAYYAATLLGCTGTLFILICSQEGVTLIPSVHFGCVILFTLSTWTRVYLNSRK